MGLLLSILIGILAGYLGSLIFKGSGNGLWINLIVGLVGGLLGGWLFTKLGIGGGGLVWELVSAVVGAIILLFILSLFKRK